MVRRRLRCRGVSLLGGGAASQQGAHRGRPFAAFCHLRARRDVLHYRARAVALGEGAPLPRCVADFPDARDVLRLCRGLLLARLRRVLLLVRARIRTARRRDHDRRVEPHRRDDRRNNHLQGKADPAPVGWHIPRRAGVGAGDAVTCVIFLLSKMR